MVTNKYIRLQHTLLTDGVGEMKCFGNSMLPIIESGSTLTFEKRTTYEVGDIVFCRVKGRYIDAHRIVAANLDRGYLIANNKGRQNGWTKNVFGKVIKVVNTKGNEKSL